MRKKLYTNCTAAVLRAKKVVMDTVTTIQENAEDIYADAKQINEEREAAEEAVEDVAEETAEEAVESRSRRIRLRHKPAQQHLIYMFVVFIRKKMVFQTCPEIGKTKCLQNSLQVFF